jgi:hypothetical protein
MFALTSHNFYYIIELSGHKIDLDLPPCCHLEFSGEQNTLLITMQQLLCEMDLNHIFTAPLFRNSSMYFALVLVKNFLRSHPVTLKISSSTVSIMPDTADTVIWTPDDEWSYHSEHVEQFTNINKLCIVAYCRKIIDIDFRFFQRWYWRFALYGKLTPFWLVNS